MNHTRRAWSVLLRKLLSNRRLVAAAIAAMIGVFALASRFGGEAADTAATNSASVTASAGSRPGTAAPGPHAHLPSSPGAAPTGHTDDDSIDDPAGDQPSQPVGAARQAGIDWIASWLNTTSTTQARWLARIEDRTTPELAEDLAEADLASIPAGRIGDVHATAAGAGLVDVAATIVGVAGKTAGTVTVTMTAAGDSWKASAVDWEPVR